MTDDEKQLEDIKRDWPGRHGSIGQFLIAHSETLQSEMERLRGKVTRYEIALKELSVECNGIAKAALENEK